MTDGGSGRPRLVVCDLDGTLVTSGYEVRPAVRSAMQAVVDAGVWITVSTGRGYQLLQPFLDRIVVNAPCICCNGALVVEADTRRILFVEPTSLPVAQQTLRYAQEEGLSARVYFDDMETLLNYRLDGAGYALVRDGQVLARGDDPLPELTRAPHKLVVFPQRPEQTLAVRAGLQERLGDQARFVVSDARIVEVIMPGMSKACGLSWLARYLSVAPEETMAIGDADNDLEMLGWAGLSVAMGNGMPAVKAAADWVAPAVDEDGVAVALQRFVLER